MTPPDAATDVAPVAGPPATESLAAASRRWGRSTTHVSAVLAAAGVYRRGRGNLGRGPLRLRVEDVDRAMRATGAAPRGPHRSADPGERGEPAPAARPPSPPADFNAVDAATGRAVWCETCAAMRACGARRAICRWCSEGRPPLRYEAVGAW